MHYYNIHNIVKICSNIELSIPDYFKVNAFKKVDIVINETKKPGNGIKTDIKYSDRYFWNPEEKALRIKYKIPFLKIEGLVQLGKRTLIEFTPSYRRHGDVDLLIESAISLNLLSNNCIMIHGGAICYKNRNIIISAWDNMGKTSTILQLLKKGNTKGIFGDDILIVGDVGTIFAYPMDINISPGTKIGSIKFSKYKKVKLFIREKISDIGGIIPVLTIGDNEPIKADEIAPIIQNGKINFFAFLEGGEYGFEKINTDTAINKLYTTSTNIEFSTIPRLHHSLMMYFYLEGNHNIQMLINKRLNILSKVLSKVDCYEMKDNKKRYAEIIDTIINSG